MNQDEEHLRLLSIFHYIVGGITALYRDGNGKKDLIEYFVSLLPCQYISALK